MHGQQIKIRIIVLLSRILPSSNGITQITDKERLAQEQLEGQQPGDGQVCSLLYVAWRIQ